MTQEQFEYLLQFIGTQMERVLVVDLADETFDIVQMPENEAKNGLGEGTKLSYWLGRFVDGGGVFEDDVERFKAQTSIDYLRRFFAEGNQKFTINYRRTNGEDYKWAALHMIPASDYSPTNQSVILYVQDDQSSQQLKLITAAEKCFAILNSLGSLYLSMHVIDLEENIFANISDIANNDFSLKVMEDARGSLRELMRKYCDDEYTDVMLEFTDFDTIADRLTNSSRVIQEFHSADDHWILSQIIPINALNDGVRPRYVVLTAQSIDEEKEREEELLSISTEMNMAKGIQEATLPSTFPAFPHRPEFDLYASMDPAKDVGGDFYDFFFVDDDHLALVCADVSGKGVPAALFMMVSKLHIKGAAIGSGANRVRRPGEILRIVNNLIAADNKFDMFVTVWLGVLEVSTGKMVTANAGHEYPAVCHANGGFELLKDKHGLVIGAMPGLEYEEAEFQLEPGDVIFAYTDGVAEATDAQKQLFGTDRMLAALNDCMRGTAEEMCTSVRTAIDGFVQDAPQFDDITMLALRYNGPVA